MAKLGILTLHGMGKPPKEEDQKFDDKLRKELKRLWNKSIRDEIAFQRVNYHPAMQGNQEETLKRMNNNFNLGWDGVREFFMHAFSDATTYHQFPEQPGSAYHKIHHKVKDRLEQLQDKLESPSSPIVVIANSLGCQVISNYIWDAQKNRGIWKTDTPSNIHKCTNLKLMITTGCNIPLFVSGLHTIEPFTKPNPEFRWLNFFDKDDVLGWPLQPLSDSYKELVEDRPIQTGITPWSHTRYWKDVDFLNPAAFQIESLYKRYFG